ncbi:spermine/spermidine synthase domain-containing protein [Hydrogenophaga laconesensis]|uniref:Spermidine synthase n=1 Tax=Hydrogenophaga laconesensis TaxID=1805971 RepID=A0ABU1VC53_9BURK|nr:spermidine synthase [Hydrogenophaga laconesensis]MDR7095058.1 spermidine synthase [Hydrogenophaga laconesensis]
MKAGANAAARARRTPQALPEVTISEDSEVRFLHLGTEWIQGSMLLDAPFDIELDYVQRMMAWLLFVEPDSVARRRALQLGLGSAALTKFCFKKLRMDTTAIEINPQVLAVCRQWFKLPADGPRLRVLLADAGEEIRSADHVGAYDALQVDLYDHEAAAPVLDSPDFYADCRTALTDDGCLTVNLFGRDASYERSLQGICAAFGADAVWAFKPTREGNTVVLAQRTSNRPTRMALLARAEAVQARWGLPAVKWLKLFKPVS